MNRITQKLILQKNGIMNSKIIKSFCCNLEYGSTINYPRNEHGINPKLNWSLARYLVTPYHTVEHNTSTHGESSVCDGESTMTVFAENWPKARQIQAAKNISKATPVFVEDGVFAGVNVRVVTGDAGLASQAKSAMAQAEFNADLDSAVVVLLDASVGKEVLVNPNTRTILAGEFFEQDLTGAISELP